MSGQSIMDRVTAAKHSIAGQGLAKSVCKATTEEVMGPKKKHLDYLLQCTNEPNVSIPQLADLLIERTQSVNWVIVFKSLVTVHNLMNYGNERFTQYLASNNCSFNLGNFIDKTGVQGYDMSTFIRRYSKYLNEKAVSYRTMAYDFCKVKRGRDDGLLRTMTTDKLLKALPVLQKQIDALLEFDCTPNELTNGVINACFMLMFKDLIRLFACYNDGTINLLEKYFDMNKKQCKEALDIYKKFLVRMDKVSEFLKVAEIASVENKKNVGIDKGDIPDLAKAPASLLDALEEHLKSLEGKKGGVTTSTSKPAGFTSAVNSISGNSSIQVSEEDRKKILEEENKHLQQLKEQKLKDIASSPSSSSSTEPPPTNNPFMTTQAPAAGGTTDLFGMPPASTAPAASKPSDDLLNLSGNPFVENVQNVMNMTAGINAMQNQSTFAAPTWGAPASGGFTSDADFAKAFNGTAGSSTMASLDISTTVTSAVPLQPSPTTAPPTVQTESLFDPLDPLGDLASGGAPPEGGSGMLGGTPLVASQSSPVPATVTSGQGRSPSPGLTTDTTTGGGFDAFGEVLTPHNKLADKNKPAQEKLSEKDLDSNLAQLAGNLSFNGTANQVKKTQHQWNPKGEQKITGGTGWTPTPVAQGATWSQPGYTQPAAPMPGMMYGGPPAVGVQQPMMQPAMGQPMMAPGMMGMPMGQVPPAGMGMAQPGMYQGMRPGMSPMGMSQPRPPSATPNDPFGAL